MSAELALVAGGSGFIGRRLVEQLRASGRRVIVLARRAPAEPMSDWIPIDLSSHDDCIRKLGKLAPATRLFYAARYSHSEGMPESVEINTAMLRNLVTVVERSGQLRHVHAVHGSRYYGHRTLDVEMPMRECHPRGGEDNFYFAQEDFLRQAGTGKTWSWSTSRPHVFCDSSPDQRRSVILAVGIYAAIRKALGEPLDFPGTQRGYSVLGQFTDVQFLAHAMEWMSWNPACDGKSLNVVNGDVLSWAELWPHLARFLHMQDSGPREISLARYMENKDAVWDDIVKRHGLKSTRLHEIADWPHADALFRRSRDIYSSMDLAASLGFKERVNTPAMFTRHLSSLMDQRILPRFQETGD